MTTSDKVPLVGLTLVLLIILWLFYSIAHYKHQYKIIDNKYNVYTVYADAEYSKGDKLIMNTWNLNGAIGEMSSHSSTSDTITVHITKVLR